MKLLFYTSAGCHLCDQALAIVQGVLPHYQLQLQQVEIADDDDLMARYGIRIPVVQVQGAAGDLGWPFDEQALRTYLDALS